MPSLIKVSLKLKGWEAMEKALSAPKFKSLLQKNVGKATGRAAKKVQSAIRKEIRKSISPKNAALTIAIKRSSKTLIDKGDLIQAIATDIQSWKLALIGIKRNDGAYSVAKALHDGTSIPVTPKMRTMFFYLWLASDYNRFLQGRKTAQKRVKPITLTGRALELFKRNKRWYPLKESTKFIIIPGRPFILVPFRGGSLEREIRREWEQAIDRTFKELAKQKG